MGFLETNILQWLTTYGVPATFIGSFFFGEAIILTSAVLTFRLGWSVTAIFTAAFLGTVISDLVWYSMGKKILHFSRSRGTSLYQKYEKRFNAIERIVPFERPLSSSFI